MPMSMPASAQTPSTNSVPTGSSQSCAPQNCTPRVNAPSTTRLVPVMKLAAELLRNTTALAISWGFAIRPVGLSPSAVANSSGSFYSMVGQTPPGK